MNVWCGAAVNTLGSCNGHFFGADRIIVSPDEGRTGSDLAPEVPGDHLCRATPVGAINQNTSPAEIKAIIRVVIIVLVNTVPENEMLCESWICRFVVYCIAVWPSFCVNSERTVHACELSPCFCFASVLSLLEKKLEALKEWDSHGGYTLHLRGCGSPDRVRSGNVSTEEKNDGSDGDVCIHGSESEIY